MGKGYVIRPRDHELYAITLHDERYFGDFGPNRWAWQLNVVMRVSPPIMCRGFQRVWRVESSVRDVLEQELRRIA